MVMVRFQAFQINNGSVSVLAGHSITDPKRFVPDKQQQVVCLLKYGSLAYGNYIFAKEGFPWIWDQYINASNI